MSSDLDKKIDGLTEQVNRLSRNFEAYIQHRAVASEGNGAVSLQLYFIFILFFKIYLSNVYHSFQLLITKKKKVCDLNYMTWTYHE